MSEMIVKAAKELQSRWGRELCLVAVLCVSAALTCAADGEVTVGFRERGKVDVPTGTTVTQDAPVWVSHEGVLDKVGDGEWVLPSAMVLSPGKTEINVRDGSVTVPAEAGTAPTLTEPTDILNKAVFWVDATRNLVTSNGEDGVDYVLAWKDVRETKAAVPFDYPRAVAQYTVTNVPPQVRQNDAGQDMVYFGEYHSGRWMSFVTPDSESTVKTISDIHHSFIVYKAAHRYWYLLGSHGGGVQTYHPFVSGANLNDPYTAINSGTSRQTIGVRGYLNGKAVDLTEERVQAGCKLLEHDFRGYLGVVNDFAEGDYTNRQGGEDLCEVVLFTNRLTEVERIQVEAWLMRKWHLDGEAANLSFAVARGAAVNVDDGKSPIVSGEGRVVKRGETTATFPDLGDAPAFTGTLAIEGGTMVMRDDVAVEAAAGHRIHAGRVADGDHLSYFSDAGNGTFAKSGAGSVLLESVPDDVKRIDVQGGVLTLAASAVATTVATGSLDAVIQDGSFETYTSLGFDSARETPKTACGWTYGRVPEDTVSDSYALIWNAKRGSNPWNMPHNSADGECVMIFRYNSYAYTEVTIPQDGTYELSFAVSRRANGYPYLDAYFGRDAESLALVTRAVCLDGNTYTYQSATLPDVKAGTYRLEFRSVANGSFSPLLDDVKVRLVSRPDAAFLIPNGGFEVIDTLPVAYATSANTVNKSNVPRGWSLTSSPRLGLALSGVTNNNGVAYQRIGDLREGRVQLFMASTGMVAVATFKPTRTGTFLLQADIGRWVYTNNYRYDGAEFPEIPHVHAVIKIGDADEVQLGGLSRDYQRMKTMTWPTTFTITDTNATVTLTVSNSVWNAVAMLDNFAFLPYVANENLIVDGGFEGTGTWTLSAPEREPDPSIYRSCSSTIRLYTDNPQFYGYDKYEGGKRLHLTDRAFATQEITFPTAGRYRLRFHSTERADSRYTPENKGLCPYRAWIARDGVTNVIGRSTSSTSNFVAHTWRFTVPDASAPWTFGFEAVNEVTSSNRDRAVLIDGVSIVKESMDLAETPDLPEKLDIAVAADAQLRLEFTGTNRINRLTLGGVPVSGIVSAQTHPAFITGDGAFEILPKGTMLIFR